MAGDRNLVNEPSRQLSTANDRGGLVFENAYNAGGAVATNWWATSPIGNATTTTHFKLEAVASPVPAPGSLALFGLGLVGRLPASRPRKPF